MKLKILELEIPKDLEDLLVLVKIQELVQVQEMLKVLEEAQVLVKIQAQALELEVLILWTQFFLVNLAEI